jgi:hypothetical protein
MSPTRRTFAALAVAGLVTLPWTLSAQQPAPPAAAPPAGQAVEAPASSGAGPGGCPGCPHGGHGHQHGRGAGMGRQGGHAGDAQHAADMEVFHFLGDHGKEITRTITTLPNGVDTLTESTNPVVAEKIKQHVASMGARVREQRPIHMRDPLFREIFANAGKILMKVEPTANGVRVVETSADPYVAKLIQAHAEVVSLFIRNGRAEMMKNHEVPPRS